MKPLTEEQQKDVEERTNAFQEKYGKLVEECQIDYANIPVYMPGENGTFQLTVQSYPVDIKYRGVPSNFIG